MIVCWELWEIVPGAIFQNNIKINSALAPLANRVFASKIWYTYMPINIWLIYESYKCNQ